MWNVENTFKVRLGGNVYVNVKTLIEYNGECLFTLKRSENDGLLGIDFDIYNKDGDRVATVRHGNVVQGDRSCYDVYEGNHHYKVTEKASGRIICDIKGRGKAENVELDLAVELYTKDGFLFKADPDQTNVSGMRISGNTIVGAETGIRVDATVVNLD